MEQTKNKISGSKGFSLEMHKSLDNGTKVWKFSHGSYKNTKDAIISINKIPVLKNDLYPSGKSLKLAISYERAEIIYDKVESLCEKVQQQMKLIDELSSVSLYRPLKDTGKLFVMKIYGIPKELRESAESTPGLLLSGKLVPRTICANKDAVTVQYYFTENDDL